MQVKDNKSPNSQLFVTTENKAGNQLNVVLRATPLLVRDMPEIINHVFAADSVYEKFNLLIFPKDSDTDENGIKALGDNDHYSIKLNKELSAVTIHLKKNFATYAEISGLLSYIFALRESTPPVQIIITTA